MPKNRKYTVTKDLDLEFNKSLIQAQTSVFEASKEKSSDSTRRRLIGFFSEHPYGKPKNRGLSGEVADKDMDQINREVKAISRAVMRHPSNEVKEQLYCIHEKLKHHFAHRDNEGIEWLLGGASAMARGGFQNVQNFKNFLNEDPRNINPSRLITGLESALTAIGYRMINASWAAAPADPANDPSATEEQKSMQLTVEGLRDYVRNQDSFKEWHHPVSSIGSIYKNRGSDDAANNISLAHDIKVSAVDISEASEADQEDLRPQKLMAERQFHKYNDAPQYSWIGAAVEGNVPVRAHTSGTAPLTLAAMDALLQSRGTDYTHVTQDKDDLRTLAGALVIPTFLRGDFHSVAETYAGVEHYIASRSQKTDPSVVSDPIQPADAFKGALKSMGDACTKDKVNGGTMPLQAAVGIVAIDVSRLVEEKEAQFTEQQTKFATP